MADVLLYQTMDGDFADCAVEALTKEHIPCFRTGTAWENLWYGRSLNSFSIFVRKADDYDRASHILIGLGADVDESPSLLKERIFLVFGFAAVVTAVVVALNWLQLS